jgi:hypothetical protein
MIISFDRVGLVLASLVSCIEVNREATTQCPSQNSPEVPLGSIFQKFVVERMRDKEAQHVRILAVELASNNNSNSNIRLETQTPFQPRYCFLPPYSSFNSMAGAERHNVALTVQEWATAVRENPNIRAEVKKPGKLHELAVSDCTFDNSASGITHTEYLHLRTVWYHYTKNHIDNFAKLLKNDNKTGYRGFISPEADDLATRLMEHKSDQLRAYLKEYDKKKQDSGYLHPSPSCGYFAMVRYWQVMTTTHTKNGRAGSSKIFKPQLGSSAVTAQASAPVRPKTPPGQQVLSTPARHVAPTSASPPKYETPATKSHPAARGTASNRPSADEAYVNTALLLLLQAVTQDFHKELGSLHWVPPRMALYLKAPALNPNTQQFEEKVLLEARVDGYLCSVRDGGLSDGLERLMAICEAKSSVRGAHQVATERQEAAEMAAWIRDRPGNEGLPQSSASGKKR